MRNLLFTLLLPFALPAAETQEAQQFSRSIAGLGRVTYSMSSTSNPAQGGAEVLTHTLRLQRTNGTIESLWQKSTPLQVGGLRMDDEFRYSNVIDLASTNGHFSCLLSTGMGVRYIRLIRSDSRWSVVHDFQLHAVSGMSAKLTSLRLRNVQTIVASKEDGKQDVYEVDDKGGIKKNGLFHENKDPRASIIVR